MAINKVIYGDEPLMDITDTTAGANDVVSGKTFYAANGVKTTGTASIPEPATAAPLADGTAAVGTSVKYAREDHVHPTDPVLFDAIETLDAAIPIWSTSTPLSDVEFGSPGSDGMYSSSSHRHPLNVPTSGAPAALGTANNGSAGTYARSDHVHPMPSISDIGLTIDSALSATSTNPLQNSVITSKIGTGTLDTEAQNLIDAVNETLAYMAGPYNSAPLSDSTNGSSGTVYMWARGNHSHPINVPTSGTPADLAATASNGTASTYARSDHVHKRPTALEIGAVPLSELDYPIYSTVVDFGFTRGSSTMLEIWTAMPNYSILICPSTDLASASLPTTSIGEIEIVKCGMDGEYGRILFWGQESTTGDYRQFLDSNGRPSFTWDPVHFSPLDAYPVGAFYISAVATSPAELFGGNWERITGRFLLAATDGGSSGASQAAGNIGGEAAHTLTTDEMAAHTHGSKTLTGSWTIGTARIGGTTTSAGIISDRQASRSAYFSTTSTSAVQNTVGFNITATHEHNSVGGGVAHNNMPPYLAVYVWQRVA